MNAFINHENEYAIRICAYLAGYYQRGPISLTKVAQAIHISRPAVGKIAFILTKKKILQTVQGRNGGIFINCNPYELSIFDILKAMEFNQTICECVMNEDHCPYQGFCQIHLYFKGQEEQLFQSFREKMIYEFAFTDANLISEKSY